LLPDRGFERCLGFVRERCDIGVELIDETTREWHAKSASSNYQKFSDVSSNVETVEMRLEPSCKPAGGFDGAVAGDIAAGGGENGAEGLDRSPDLARLPEQIMRPHAGGPTQVSSG